MKLHYKSVHSHSAGIVVGMGLGVLFPFVNVILSLAILIIIWNYFLYKIAEEDSEEIPVVDSVRTETAHTPPKPLINLPLSRPYTPRNPPIPISAYEKSRAIMLEKK